MSTISIIVPVYKVEPYLRRCVDSILNQTYKDIEIILIDDGSPDGCGTICDEYAAMDSHVVVIHQKNAGVSAARNAGLDASKGEYIGFVDGDDWIEPNMYEVLHHIITTCGADIAEVSYTTEDKKQTRANSDKYISFSSNEAMNKILNGQWEMFYVWNKLFRKGLIENIRFSEKLAFEEDGLFAIQAIAQSSMIAYTSYCGYHYIIYENSSCHSFKDSFWSTLDGTDMIISVMKAFDCKFADVADKCAVEHSIVLAKTAEEKGKFSKLAAKKVSSHIQKYIDKSVWKLFSFKEKCLVCLLLFGRIPFIVGRKLWRTFMRLKTKICIFR